MTADAIEDVDCPVSKKPCHQECRVGRVCQLDLKTMVWAEGECYSCGDPDWPEGECRQSRRPCGHHCNHALTDDHCHWCGAEDEALADLAPAAAVGGSETTR